MKRKRRNIEKSIFDTLVAFGNYGKLHEPSNMFGDDIATECYSAYKAIKKIVALSDVYFKGSLIENQTDAAREFIHFNFGVNILNYYELDSMPIKRGIYKLRQHLREDFDDGNLPDMFYLNGCDSKPLEGIFETFDLIISDCTSIESLTKVLNEYDFDFMYTIYLMNISFIPSFIIEHLKENQYSEIIECGLVLYRLEILELARIEQLKPNNNV